MAPLRAPLRAAPPPDDGSAPVGPAGRREPVGGPGAWAAHLVLGLVGLVMIAVLGFDLWRSDLTTPLLGLAAATLLARTARLGTPDRRAWLWLSCGTALWSLGDLTWALIDLEFPSRADWIYLAGYASFGVGVAKLSGTPSRIKALDAAIMTLATSLWLLVVFHPALAPLAELEPFAAFLAVAYPAADVVLLACAVSMLLGRSVRNRSLHLLALGLLLILLGDLSWIANEVSGTFESGTLVDGGWQGIYAMLAAAAIHPHRRTTDRSGQGVSVQRRAVLLAVAVASGPVALVVNDRDDTGLTVLLSAVAVVLAVLAGTRMALLVTELGRAVRFDPLTGTLSRTGLADTHHDDGYALLFCDVNRFKGINDTYGHDVGDAVLELIAQRISNELRAEDRVARFGGDEFVVICPGVDEGSGVELVAARMRRALSTAVVVAPHGPIPVTVSVGATWVPPGETFQQALRRADTEMYREKRTAVSAVRP